MRLISCLTAFAVTVAALLATACGGQPPQAPIPMDVIVVDHSPSVRTRTSYFLNEARDILGDAARRHSHVLIGEIGALNTATWPIDRKFNATGNAFARTRKNHRTGAQAVAALHQLLAGPSPAASSDLLASTLAAARVLRDQRGARKLWIISDAHQVGDGVNLYTADLSTAGIRRTLARLRVNGMLADLRGVEIHFDGVGLDAARQGTSREVDIERFWKAWTHAAGATLASFDSHSRLPAGR
jgi:hypothetical protein